MDKKNKIKLLEIIILLIIIILIVIIGIILYTVLNKNPKLSNSNEVKNYSITRHYKAILPIDDAYIYQIPYPETITIELSKYTSYIIATDNVIDSIIEEISLNYIELPQEKRNDLINYCNGYDEVKSGLLMKCKINGDFLILSNEFHIYKLYTNIIETNKMTITLPIGYNEKITDYIEKKSKEGVLYSEIASIE